MNRRTLFGVGLIAALSLTLVAGLGERTVADEPGATVAVTRGPLGVWASYPGRLEAHNEIRIASQLSGAAVLLELLPEGTVVSRDDVVARFDSGDIDLQVLELEEAYTAAQAEHEGLVSATQPMEIEALELELLAARQELSRETRFLDESRALADEGFLSPEELTEQGEKVGELELRVRGLKQAQRLTAQYLHPAAVRRAAARLHTAERALALAREKQAATIVRAPAPGVVLYPAVHVGNEYRQVRIGDSVFTNQVFLALPDVSNLVAHCEIPESELAQIAEGTHVWVRPLAHPEVRLAGAVLRLGRVAQPVAGQPSWQRYFRAVVALDEQSGGLLRPGMSVMVDMLAYHASDAVLVPRRAVNWDGGAASVIVARGPFDERRSIVVGRGNHENFQILNGLEPGERLRIQ